MAQFSGKIIQEGRVRLDVDVRVVSLRQQPRALFEIEILAVLQAESQEVVVCRLAIEMADDFLRAPPPDRIAVQRAWTQPGARGFSTRKDFLAHRFVNRRVLVAQQIEQGRLFAFAQFTDRGFGGCGFHQGCPA